MPTNTIVILALGLLLVMWMSYSGRRARAKQEEQRNSIIAVGTSVMTTAGFYGTIVDVDGDAITLQSPSGDETVWDRRAIARAAELPLGTSEDSVDELQDEDSVLASDEPAESAPEPTSEEPDTSEEPRGTSAFDTGSSERPTSPFSN